MLLIIFWCVQLGQLMILKNLVRFGRGQHRISKNWMEKAFAFADGRLGI